MLDKSEPASLGRRVWVPRGLLLAWLWVNVPATVLEWTGCPWPAHAQFCERVGNTVGDAFGLLPMTLMMAFPASTPLLIRVAIPVAGTAACHWLALRFLPPRLGLARFVSIGVAWFVLSWLAFLGSLFLPN